MGGGVGGAGVLEFDGYNRDLGLRGFEDWFVFRLQGLGLWCVLCGLDVGLGSVVSVVLIYKAYGV